MNSHVKQSLNLVLLAGSLGGLSAASSAALAQAHDHAGHSAQTAPADAAEAWAEGEVRRVNKAAGTLTLRHGELRSVGMPPMTMVFSVDNTQNLEGLAEGDKVRFTVRKAGSQLIVTRLQKAPAP
ncbi:MAG: copper-binding protein [Limnobacter sp.]|uniref:copper-binding protein n=1 Tax=Limnobacter sp. TaxID=2003368 RepID=UPI00391AD815